MNKLNNVDMGKVMEFGGQIRNDSSKARRTQVVEGEWLIKEGGPQFQSAVTFEGGQTMFEVDNPTFMGGGGKYHYA